MFRWDIINHFVKKYGYKEYLEVGYYKGWSFDRVDLPQKTAVDPYPCKTPEQEIKTKGQCFVDDTNKGTSVIFKMTSDDFFASITRNTKWDIIFIDGLHKAEQVSKDFQNALSHLSPNGTIVLHDCSPSSYVMTTTGTTSGEWTGDCYRVAMKLRHIYPYNFYTVDTDYGVGVYRDSELSAHWEKVFGIPESPLPTIEWESFDTGRKELLNLITPEEFLQREHING